MINPAAADETTDWAQRGSQSRAFPQWKPGDPVRVLSPETLREMPVPEAALVLGLLWAALSNPEFMRPKAGQPSGETASEEDPEELTRVLQSVPESARDAILHALRDRRATLSTTLAILRGLRAHRRTSIRRPAPEAVPDSQRIRMLISAQPTHAPPAPALRGTPPP